MNYLQWLNATTPGVWWHDSAIPEEIDDAVSMGAKGITTNPVLTYKTLSQRKEFWENSVSSVPKSLQGSARAEAMLKIVATYAAAKVRHIYDETRGLHGYAFGQLNPALSGDKTELLEQGLRVASWAENVAVKVATSRAALYVIEELAARGIAVCASLNFSVSQALAVSRAYECGLMRAKEASIAVKPCYIVQQGGRLEDYLRDVAKDLELYIQPEIINCAGNLVTKKSCRLFEKHGYNAVIMPAGLRGVHHLTELAGANIAASLQSRIQKMIIDADPPKVERYQEPTDDNAAEILLKIPDFRKAYVEYALPQDEFITFGVFQKTLSQFMETGWALLETFGSSKTSTRWF